MPRPMLFLCLLALLAASPRAAEVRDHDAVRVAAHTWVIHGPLGDPSVENQGFMNNPAFVVTADGVVVIDPGSSVQAGRMVLRQIRKLTDKPVTHVLNTHVHGDHWLGNQAFREAFPDAVIMASPEMIHAAHAGHAARWLDIMSRLTEGFTRDTRAVIPAVAVTENQTVRAGGVEFRIMAPPKAHSGTDIMIHVPAEGVLFLGDNVMNGRFGQMDDGTFQGNIAACKQAMAVPAQVFVPGHGLTGDKTIVATYHDYLATLFSAVRQEYDAGKQDYQMKDSVKARLSRYAGWIGFDQHFGRHLSVAVLELEAL